MFSTSGDIQYIGGRSVHRGYHKYIRGISWVHWTCSVDRGISRVHWRMFCTSGDTISILGDIMSTSGDILSTLEDIMSTLEDTMSTLGDVQYIKVYNRNWKVFINLLPYMYHIPLMYWTSPNVLMTSPDVLKVSPRCIEHPPMYWKHIMQGGLETHSLIPRSSHSYSNDALTDLVTVVLIPYCLYDIMYMSLHLHYSNAKMIKVVGLTAWILETKGIMMQITISMFSRPWQTRVYTKQEPNKVLLGGLKLIDL